MQEQEENIKPMNPVPAPEVDEPAIPPVEAPEGSRMRRPWRWILGAVSIAAVGAGVVFISKRGLRKTE